MIKIRCRIAGLALVCASSALAVQYSIQDLGYVGALRLNNSGDYAGRVYGTTGLQGGAFIHEKQVSHDLQDELGLKSFVNDMNDSGQVVGTAQSGAWLWDNGSLSYLALGGGAGGTARSVNNQGTIVGSIDEQIALWVNGTPSLLGTFGGEFAEGLGINDVGQIIGVSSSDDGSTQSFFYDGSDVMDLGNSLLSGVNNTGQVIGSLYANGRTRPFLWSEGLFTFIDALPDSTHLADINNRGDVVGSFTDPSGEDQAFLYTDGSLIDLIDGVSPLLGWTRLVTATGVNDLGEIVGTGWLNGELHGYMLTPIPEPGSSWFVLIAFTWRKARRGP